MFRSSACSLRLCRFSYTRHCACGCVRTLRREEAAFRLPCLDFVPPAFLSVVLTGLASTFRGKLAGGGVGANYVEGSVYRPKGRRKGARQITK